MCAFGLSDKSDPKIYLYVDTYVVLLVSLSLKKKTNIRTFDREDMTGSRQTATFPPVELDTRTS